MRAPAPLSAAPEGRGLRAWRRGMEALAKSLSDHKEDLYDLSYATGATKGDSWIDIDGGISTLFVYSSKGTRELPDGRVHLDGNVEALSKVAVRTTVEDDFDRGLRMLIDGVASRARRPSRRSR